MSLPTRNLSAIVTGSSRGIGPAIALRLANDGFSVALDGLPSMQKGLETLSRKIKSTGWESMIDPCDVTDEKAVGGMVDRTVKELADLYVVCTMHLCPSYIFIITYCQIDSYECKCPVTWQPDCRLPVPSIKCNDSSSIAVSLQTWNRFIDINLTGVFLCYSRSSTNA